MTTALVKKRIDAIDMMRGLVILLMLLDHVRERFYYHVQVSDPMDISITEPGLFFSRFAAHFCAPVFVFLTGLSVADNESGRTDTILDRFIVEFRHLSDDEINCYIRREQPLNCAGSFKSEGLGITLFEKMTGDDPNSLIGLPLIRLHQMLKNFGVDLLLQGQ